MHIIVTGATGGLGRSTLEFLSRFSSPGTFITGTTRTLSRAPYIPGVLFRRADFCMPESLDLAFAGASRVLIISSSSFDDDLRLAQHRNAIDACVRVGIERVYYTSLGICGKKEVTVSALQQMHLETEKMIKASNIPYTIIREGIYAECFPLLLSWHPTTTSTILPGDGPISFASRTELAEGTARLLLSDDPQYLNSTILLTGPSTFTFAEITVLIREIQGTPLTLEILPEDEYVRRIVASRERPEWFAKSWASSFRAFSDGESGEVDLTLEALLGRKPRGAEEVIRALLVEGKDNEEGGYTWHQNAKLRAIAKHTCIQAGVTIIIEEP